MPAVSPVHPRLTEVTRRIVERSRESRQRYLARLDQAASKEPVRKGSHAPIRRMAGLPRQKKRQNHAARNAASQRRHRVVL